MKFTKKFIALLLSALMVVGLIPALSIASTVEKVQAQTESAQKEMRINELLDFNSRLHDMTVRHTNGIRLKYAKKIGEDDPFVSARIIVKSKKAPDFTGSIAHVDNHKGLWVIQYASPDEAREALRRFEKTERIEYAQPDRIMHAEMVPHENNFKSWGFGTDYMKTYEYSEVQLENTDVSSLPEVIVAVIDTGIDFDHPFFENRILDTGYDFANDDNLPQDDEGHGSHVCGTICDGTLPNVKIMPLKALDSHGSGYTSSVNNAMEYAYEQGAHIVNMSLGGKGNDFQEEAIINEGTSRGTLYCVAAGNEDDDASRYSPAYIPNAFTIAACDNTKTMASFSNYGRCVDITAPGVKITSVMLGGGWQRMSGTSMACPHAAAAAAMVKTFNIGFTPDEIVNWLKDSAEKVSFPRGGGAGFLRLYSTELPATPTPVPTAAPEPTPTPEPTPVPTFGPGEIWTLTDTVKPGNEYIIVAGGKGKAVSTNALENGIAGVNVIENNNGASISVQFDDLESVKWTAGDNLSFKVGYRYLAINVEGGFFMEASLGLSNSAFNWTKSNNDLSAKVSVGFFGGTKAIYYLACDGENFTLADGTSGNNIRFYERAADQPDPTPVPTPEPTQNPTPEPTQVPTPEPTQEPTPEPTQEPTPEPTEEPTPEPTQEPTPEPTQPAGEWQLADTLVAGEDYIIVAGGKGKALSSTAASNGLAAVNITENNGGETITVNENDLEKIVWTVSGNYNFKNGSKYLAIKTGGGFYVSASLGLNNNAFGWTRSGNDLYANASVGFFGMSNQRFSLAFDGTNFGLSESLGNNIKFYHRVSAPAQDAAAVSFPALMVDYAIVNCFNIKNYVIA